MPLPPILAVQIGNTRVQLGLFDDEKLDQSFRFANDDIAAIVAQAAKLLDEIKDGKPQAAIMFASVNEKAAKPLQSMLEDQLGTRSTGSATTCRCRSARLSTPKRSSAPIGC